MKKHNEIKERMNATLVLIHHAYADYRDREGALKIIATLVESDSQNTTHYSLSVS